MHSSVLAAQKAGFHAHQIWLSDNPEKEDLELGTAMDGVFMRATWVPMTPHPLSKEFLSSFISAYGGEPEYHAAGGFACCQVLEQIVEAAGTWDNEVLRGTLLKRSFQTVMGEIRFRESGLPDSTIMLCQWQNRKLEIVYPNWAKTAEARFEPARH
jgi:branched-chain amino acid transport system substrate-binding protein